MARSSAQARALVALLLLLAAPAAAASASSAPGGDKLSLRWQGKPCNSASLPANFPASARAALERWTPFCLEAGYRVEVDGPGRLVLVVSERSSRVDEQQRTLAKLASWFDAHFPPPAPAAESLPPAGGDAHGQPGGEIPEDPERPPQGAPTPAPPASTPAPAKPAAGSDAGGECAALFVLRGPEDLGKLLARLAQIAPELAEWTHDARKETGFVLLAPLAAAFLESAPELKEWSPAHEIVDRATQLFFLRRYGEQPFWLQQGVAWAAEWAFDGTLYSFPYRREFVYAAEHGAWPNELRNLVAGRADQPLQFHEFALWRRGHWDSARAHLAFGMSALLATQPGAKLAAALDELRRFRDQDNRKDLGGGNWRRDPDYEIPAEKQLALLEQHLGTGLMERLTAFLAKGNESFKQLERAPQRP